MHKYSISLRIVSLCVCVHMHTKTYMWRSHRCWSPPTMWLRGLNSGCQAWCQPDPELAVLRLALLQDSPTFQCVPSVCLLLKAN